MTRHADPNELWMAAMRDGRFEEAWAINDGLRSSGVRVHQAELPRHQQTVWNGTPVDNRRVLVRCYHGLGDTIQFIRYAPLLRARAREVGIWAQPRLVALLRRMPRVDYVRPLHDGAPDWTFDVDLEVMELPYLFRSTLESLPRTVPYLTADAGRRSLPPAPDPTPRVGLVWRAGDWDPRRSITIPELRPLLDVPVHWHFLQSEMTGEERALASALGRQCTDLGMEDTAAMIASLDLLITIDSMPAHLAGALAIPVWTLLHDAPDWRWMHHRDDSPWYPTMGLFRQGAGEGWTPLIRRVVNALAALAPRRRSPAVR